MPPNVRVIAPEKGGDTHEAGRARVRLKLGALGYVNARHGVDGDAQLAREGMTRLCGLAVEYYAALTGTPAPRPSLDPRDQIGLKLAAIAYVSARHGIDGDVGIAREGLAMLCASALAYAEAVVFAAGGPPATGKGKAQGGSTPLLERRGTTTG